MKISIEELKTGDIILFNNMEHGFFSIITEAIKYGSHSNYTHIGMILKNPTYIHKSLRGTYVWESGWEGKPDPQDGKVKMGVQITPIHEMIDEYNKTGGKIMIRKIETELDKLDENYPFNDEKMKEIHTLVYDKPYDMNPFDWVDEVLGIPPNKHTDRFWCSAFVGYIFVKTGILNEDTDWSKLTPSDFSIDGENLEYVGKNKLENCEIRI
jgi:hypothetical protein